MSYTGPGGSPSPEPANGRLDLRMINPDLESEFDTVEFDCGGDTVEAEMEGGCIVATSVVDAETGNNGYGSMVVGSDGVWKVTGPPMVPGGPPAVTSPCRLLRRRRQRNKPTRVRRTPAHAPTAIPPMAPPLNLEKNLLQQFSSTTPRGCVLTKMKIHH